MSSVMGYYKKKYQVRALEIYNQIYPQLPSWCKGGGLYTSQFYDAIQAAILGIVQKADDMAEWYFSTKLSPANTKYLLETMEHAARSAASDAIDHNHNWEMAQNIAQLVTAPTIYEMQWGQSNVDAWGGKPRAFSHHPASAQAWEKGPIWRTMCEPSTAGAAPPQPGYIEQIREQAVDAGRLPLEEKSLEEPPDPTWTGPVIQMTQFAPGAMYTPDMVDTPTGVEFTDTYTDTVTFEEGDWDVSSEPPNGNGDDSTEPPPDPNKQHKVAPSPTPPPLPVVKEKGLGMLPMLLIAGVAVFAIYKWKS